MPRTTRSSRSSNHWNRGALPAFRWFAVLALLVGSAVFIGGGSAPVEDPEAIPEAQLSDPVPVDEVRVEELDLEALGWADDNRTWDAGVPHWPSAAMAKLKPTATAQQVGAMPITLSASSDVGEVVVDLHDQVASEASGVNGVIIELEAERDGDVELTIDYSAFANAYGGGWASRLRIIELVDCTPGDGCGQVISVDSVNGFATRTVSATVDGTGVYALSAASGGESGDYSATDLQAAGSWSAGGSAGGFSYNYPLRTPPAAGPVPALGLGYSSQSHDGRTSGSNNQASWIGDGWSYEPGYIERTYKSCAMDQEGSNNNPDKTGDKCWDGDSDAITLSLNGTNTALVKDDSTGQWRAAADTNWKIQKLGSKATTSTATTEYWKVTTTDGTQYFFAGEAASSKSRWTVPVFGNHSGEACRASAFKDSMCQQAWRWMVDKVVDVHGNQAVYTYATETGHYGAAGDENKRTSYIRGGDLTRIDYGLRSDDASVTPTGRVLFNLADRCLTDCGTTGSPKTANWPDTPWDLTCESAPCTDQRSPSFFSSKRLDSIRTQVADGSTFRDVDSWKLEHEFKDYGDDSQVVLWLKSIQHTGHVGGSITLPKTSFAGQAMPNRVETQSGIPEIWRWRITAVTTETGGVIGVNYSEPDCGNGDLPSTEQTNSRLCYPVYWTPDQYMEAEKDWFHKYVVTSIVEQDATAGMVPITTYYEYSTAGGGVSALWAWDDGEFTDDDHRTYSQWRGYSRVTTKTGDPSEGPQLTSRTQYYRGMNDQPLPNGSKRSVQLTDSQGNTVTDHRALAGMVFEAVTFDGAVIDSASVSKYWTKRTASRSHDGGRLEAWMSGESEKTARKRLTSTAWHTTRTKTGYDDYGRVTQVDDLGDTTTAADDLCSRTEYADNTSQWILSAVARSETVSVACTASPNRPDDVVSDTRTYFDGSTTFETAPTKGLPTRTEVIDSWSSSARYQVVSTSTFDALGRLVSATDALGRETTTSYTPGGAGPVTSNTVTNPLGHTVTSYLEPAWGTVTATIDANNRRTDLTFDALGRSLEVWLPGQSKASNALPHYKFSYDVSRAAPSTITSQRLMPHLNYSTSIQVFDSLLRPIQTQSDTPVGGRLVTETDYNTRGQVVYNSGPNWDETSKPNGTFVRVEQGSDHARTFMSYDALDRTVKEEFWTSNEYRWETVYGYGGSPDGFLSTVTPPDGAVKTAVLTNARGQEIEKRQYHSGGYDATTYAYTPRGELSSVVDAVGNSWSYEYDLRGNTVRTSDPDVGVVTATYDVAGQKTSTTDARGVTVSTVYDELGRTVETWEGEAENGSLMSVHGTATWAIAMGSMAVTVRRKDPYGNARGGAVNWAAGQKGFVGGVEDPTGLVHIGARSYDPTLGKFISADPIRDFTDPQQINGYTYANANPVTMSDSTGLMRYDPVTGEGVGVPTGLKGGSGNNSGGGNTCVPGITAAACPDFVDPERPVEIALESGGNVIIFSDGTMVIDGYVIPSGHPDPYSFIYAYDQAASEFGYIGGDSLADAIRLAMIACDLLGGSLNACSYDFELILQYDYDAWELGTLLPSYLDGEPTFYSDGDEEWSAIDYALWAKMLNATGIEKRAYQKALAAGGHTSKPGGVDLPWNPMDSVMGCILGGLGIGAFVSVMVDAKIQKEKSGKLTITKTGVRGAGVAGCISGALL
ncbi:RHS repeat-associated protein [Stackebrandtia endophytica]|uniref:RHS repeat-associated protein n=1 Tax=Stackebrandtia endophytica TaxID=1496996 RepID=A0A543AZM4_9ACTN|nr:RHS repeat-associated core domain-containing protein [Stackebrandtia endophytica]TQL78028.1 RHS repeat-associated protein [Stackebrandtia endophytica]